MRNLIPLVGSTLLLLWASVVGANELPSSVEFFESRIRPILIQNCYECHSSHTTHEGSLSLDFREGLLQGGESGPVIVPGRPDDSLLLQVIEHRAGDLKMPPSGLQLSPEVLDDFRRWIEAGANDPREHPPSEKESSASGDWRKIREARKSWWSFQPIESVVVPEPDSPQHPIDQFVVQQLTEQGLKPNDRASNEVLIRRLFWNLIGLPPSRHELSKWTQVLTNADKNSNTDSVSVQWTKSWGQLVDTLLMDPRFGERWARHWMDWIRYAESHGSEGDPAIVNAWLYRDYLIRAFNESLPLDQMLREHIAGDLLPPRFDAASHLNQALIATAHWRMVFHGFSPVDAMEERVRFTDDQINTFSKAFLGITLSCARCHDHKFDPISQADYYAMFGVLSSCRPGRLPANSDAVLRQHHEQLSLIQAEIRLALASRWEQSLHQMPQRLQSALDKVMDTPNQQLTPAQVDLKKAWKEHAQLSSESKTQSDLSPAIHWDLTQPEDQSTWSSVGTALEHRPMPGDPVIAISGQQALAAIYSRGVSSRILSDKESARLSSPDFLCPPNSVLWVLCEGDGGAALRYVVEDYPRNGTIYPVYPLKPGLQWIQSDLGYWSGDSLHIELSHAADAPLLTGSQPRSWFRIVQVWVLPKGQRPPESQSLYHRLCPPADAGEKVKHDTWVEQITQATRIAIENWSVKGLSVDEAELLDLLASNNILPNDLSDDRCRHLIEEYRKVESDLVVATRVPCLEETSGQDFPLLTRGDHRQPAEIVPRRFLEAIDSRPYMLPGSGRLELAERVLADDNPLTRRVVVNRVWQNLFGVGLVSTSDNFGRLGTEPTHPELLDWLAMRLPQLDWSLKKLIREIVTTETWLRSSTATAESLSLDPENRWLGRATVRRYEAEAIRDALLFVTGTLDASMFGPPQPADGRRRSVYLPVIRNSLVPLLRTFDFPEPFATVGKRDQTNVPAQSLALMNDPLIASLARRWTESLLEQETDPQLRAQSMLESVLARTASPEEVALSLAFIQETRHKLGELVTQSNRLSDQIASLQQQMNGLEAPARQSLRVGSPSSELTDTKNYVQLPQPILAWDFSELSNVSQTNSLEFFGAAKIDSGALVLKDGGYALSSAQSALLREKTMTAWVQLENLNQRGGGVVSVQSMDGNVFDSIVYGEQTPAHWLAGSNFFSRTQSFQGEAESTAVQTPVHLALVYQADGKILAYRNGQLYGQPYQSSGVQEYLGEQWRVSLGLRHLPAASDKTLTGKIWSASVYGLALAPEQIAKLAGSLETPISQEQLLTAMPAETREKWSLLSVQLQENVSKRSEVAAQLFAAAYDSNEKGDDQKITVLSAKDLELLSWTDFARALFTLKEFIYVP